MSEKTVKQKYKQYCIDVLICVVLIEIILQIAGGLFFFAQNIRNSTDTTDAFEKRILCIGESTTALGGPDSYPSQLEVILNKQSATTTYKVINKGIPGVTTSAIIADLPGHIDQFKPHIIVAMMGFNDTQYGLGDNQDFESGQKSVLQRRFSALKTIKLVKRIYKRLYDQTKELIYRQQGWDTVGRYYMQDGQHFKAEEAFQQAIQDDPSKISNYLFLGEIYRREGLFGKAIEVLKLANQALPDQELANIQLGKLFIETKEYSQAQNYLDKAVALNPENPKCYLYLGLLWKKRGLLEKAKESFAKSEKLNGKEFDLYYWWAEIFLDQRQFEQSELYLTKALQMEPENELAYSILAFTYQAWNKPDKAREIEQQRDALINQSFNPITRRNFNQLKSIANDRQLELIVIQYPMQSLNPLRRMFADTNDIIFVDNEKIFKEVVAKEGYGKIFTDNFGGNFGHCTKKGNYFLAHNIWQSARSVLED